MSAGLITSVMNNDSKCKYFNNRKNTKNSSIIEFDEVMKNYNISTFNDILFIKKNFSSFGIMIGRRGVSVIINNY